MNGQPDVDAVDLDGYFERVRWHGTPTVNLATLQALLQAHMRHIPFENLDVLLGRPVRLDLDSVQAKLIRAARGGYCFEHATLFAAVLQRLGFDAVSHTARVTLFAPRTASPRGHMFLSVTLPEGRFVVDPGFGALASTEPVPIPEDEPCARADATHWLQSDAARWTLKVRTADAVVDAWVTTMEPEHAIDFEVGNHFMSTHPDSPMRRRLMLCARPPRGQVTVMNQELTVREGTRSTVHRIADRVALRGLLREHFGFDLADVERLRVPSIAHWT